MYIKGTVLVLSDFPDSSGDIINKKTKIIIKDRVVPVTLDFDKTRTVGWAKIKKTKKGVKAKIYVKGHQDLLLTKSIETLLESKNVYGAIGGRCINKIHKFPNYIIERMEITDIALCLKNAHPSVPPLKVDLKPKPIVLEKVEEVEKAKDTLSKRKDK